MKTFRSIVAVFAFAAIFAVSGFAQTTPAAPVKIGIVNTQAFAAKTGGITKYINALTALDTELKTDQNALQTMVTKIQNLEKELADLEKQVNTPNPPPTMDLNKVRASAQSKYQEYQDLGRQFKFEEERYKVKFERREDAVVRPVSRDIGNALTEFAKKNGYVMIFDVSKDQGGMLLFLDEKQDVTKDFIAFYNARPATTAAVK